MNIATLLLKPDAMTGSHSGLFLAERPGFGPYLMCRDSFFYKDERDKILSEFPNVFDWEVIKENVTKEDVAKYSTQGSREYIDVEVNFEQLPDGTCRIID